MKFMVKVCLALAKRIQVTECYSRECESVVANSRASLHLVLEVSVCVFMKICIIKIALLINLNSLQKGFGVWSRSQGSRTLCYGLMRLWNHAVKVMESWGQGHDFEVMVECTL